MGRACGKVTAAVGDVPGRCRMDGAFSTYSDISPGSVGITGASRKLLPETCNLTNLSLHGSFLFFLGNRKGI